MNSKRDPELNEVPYQKGNRLIYRLPKPRPWKVVVKRWLKGK